ncbi:carboxymuconolactone decarboxylase family protein [Avibacterium avium]
MPDEVYQHAIAHFSEQELAELTFVIGIINAWNRFGIAFAVQPK